MSANRSCLVLSLLCTALCPTATLSAQSQGLARENLKSAVTGLRASDDSERQTSREVLRRNRKNAIPLLLALYNEICIDRVRLYSNEALAQEALENEQQAVRTNDSERINLAQAALNRFDVTNRVREDTIKLLTQMRSRKAVHAFTNSLRNFPSNIGPTQPIYGELKALIEIGQSGIPDLLNALDFSLQQPYDKESNLEVHLITILREIGDPRALPALERMRDIRIWIRPIIDEAISYIRKQS